MTAHSVLNVRAALEWGNSELYKYYERNGLGYGTVQSCCHKRTYSLPPSISPAGGKECENPGYESDTVSISRISSDIASTSALFQKVILPSSTTPSSSKREANSESPIFSESDQEFGSKAFSPNYRIGMNEVKPVQSVSDNEYDCKRKKNKTFPCRRYSSRNGRSHLHAGVIRGRRYTAQKGRSVPNCSSSDSDRNCPDSSTRYLKAAKRITLTSGSESDFSLTSVSSLSAVSAIPMLSMFSKTTKANSNHEKTAACNSLKNSWLAKM